MLIIGAGMSGLLAAHMLRRFSPVIHEAQLELPNNHSALLRFRSDAVSRATGIPFKKVWVQKAICFEGQLYNEGNMRFNNMYSAKVTGKVHGRSIMNLQPGERYIAPDNFISQMASGCDVRLGIRLTQFLNRNKSHEPMISTIPMGAMMDMVEWKGKPDFDYSSITTLSCDIDGVDVYQTLYYPGDETQAYRASITGSHLMVEVMGNWWNNVPEGHKDSIARQIASRTIADFGIMHPIRNVQWKVQKYGKIYPIDSNLRKQFILAMTDKYNIYSVGRFATWRQILMDDVVKDIALVEQMISERSAYAAHLPEYAQL